MTFTKNTDCPSQSYLWSSLSIGIHAPSHLLTYDFILNHPIQLIYQTISSLAAALAVIGLSYYLCRYSATSKVMKWIGDIGIFTLGIYGTQVLVLENIVKNIIHIDASTFYANRRSTPNTINWHHVNYLLLLPCSLPKTI